MTLSLDHVVIRVRDLEQTIADYNELGFAVQRGTHADGATHNALIGFADGSYFELIAFLRDAPEIAGGMRTIGLATVWSILRCCRKRCRR